MLRSALIWMALGFLLVTGCERRDSVHAPLTIFAASSLTEAFRDLSTAFSQRTGAPQPTLVFGGSQILRLQIEHGAPADPKHMNALIASGHVEKSEVFAYNELALIVPKDNPAAIRELSELPRARRLVVGAPEVPIGIYTRELFDRAERSLGPELVASMRARIVSEESNVRLVRAKVELGEADAAIVYRTDLSDTVRAIEIPSELAVRASYSIALVAGSSQRAAAEDWIAFVESAVGRAVLHEHGFATR